MKDFLSPHRNGDMPQENPAIRDDPTKPVAEADLDRLPTDPSRGTFSTEAFVYNEEKDVYLSTEAAKTRYNKGFSLGERPFGQIKHGFGLRRFQTRGGGSVSSEFFLATLAHNLVRLTNHLGSLGNLRALTAAKQQEKTAGES